MARRVWALRGHRPSSCGRTKDRCLDVHGFVPPAGGRDLELILPRADAEWTSRALAELAGRADPRGDTVPVLIWGNAGWHGAEDLVVPPDGTIHPLPPHTPELQPTEPLRPPVREAVANKASRGWRRWRSRLWSGAVG